MFNFTVSTLTPLRIPPLAHKRQTKFFASRSKMPSKAHRIHEEFLLNFQHKMLPLFVRYEKEKVRAKLFHIKHTQKKSLIDDFLNAVIYDPRSVCALARFSEEIDF